MKRSTLAALGREAVEIMKRGTYRAPSGVEVSIADAQARAVAATREYRPTDGDLREPRRDRSTRFEVTPETTLEAAARLASTRPLALNFASATKPGGGFLGGAQAQEESIARSSSLYAAIAFREMHRHHSHPRNPMYTSWAITSPDVPVFRKDDGTLLERPYATSFLTCAAVNAGVVLARDPSRKSEIMRAMRERIRRILAIAAHEDYATLILGAWGCGVFRNDTEDIALAFREALDGPFAGAFERVVFAVYDTSTELRFRGPFVRRFA